MKSKRTLTQLYTGLLLLLAGGATAWSVGREAPASEPAPMERLLEGSAGAAAVSWDLPYTRNERVDDWIDFLKDDNAKHTEVWLERSGRYAPMIQAELRRRGMPEDLLYLALIESGFSPRAKSVASAVGIWQFIEETGERYGLQVNNELDERRDPLKATSAALDYLQELHDRFGSWYLAAAAYNTGENRVARIMRERTGSERGADSMFWKIAPQLPRETRNYVPLMLAAGHIAKEPAKYGFDALEYQEPLDFDVAWVPGATDLAVIAEAAGAEKTTIEDLNPQLVRSRTPSGRGWAVRIPAGSKVAFSTRFPTLFQAHRLALAEADAKAKQAAASAQKHRVKRGETLGAIAQRYGVSVASLQKVNDVSPRRLRIGQTLTVPSGAKDKVAASTTPRARARTHTVRRGENLSVIASRYDVSVRQLQRWNGMPGRSRIYAGQKLRVQG